MKKIILLTILFSFSAFSSESIHRPKIKGAEIQCSSNKDDICNHLGFSKALEYSCSKKIRNLVMSKKMDTVNNKSVKVFQRDQSCEESTWWDIEHKGSSAMLSVVEIQCKTFATYASESGETEILKSITCE